MHIHHVDQHKAASFESDICVNYGSWFTILQTSGKLKSVFPWLLQISKEHVDQY